MVNAKKAATLVLNAGSSSLKFKVFEETGSGALKALASGNIERIGDLKASKLKVRAGRSRGAIGGRGAV